MDRPDFVVRRWALTTAGHARVTAVDMHGRIFHYTIHERELAHGDIETLIRNRLAALPAPKVYRQ